MKTHFFNQTKSLPATFNGYYSYWEPSVYQQLIKNSWAVSDLNNAIDIKAWASFLPNLPRDPYVACRWKRMSWIYFDENDHMKMLKDCPMAQGAQYNDAQTMANRLRYYPSLETTFLQREDVKSFVRAWRNLWDISANMPILLQINGIRGKGIIDPLQGQGVHQDGSKYLSVLVINRDNVQGAKSYIYDKKTSTSPLAEVILNPGEILHLKDDEIFHDVSEIQPSNPDMDFERFIIIINSCFNDEFQNQVLKDYFPDVVIS